MITQLPESNKIDISKLGRLFDNMTESYKIFWFQAIVDLVFIGNDVLTYKDLINEMIASGWYMVSEYKLNLGPNDTMEKMILTAFNKFGIKANEKKETIIKELNEKMDDELLRMEKVLSINVPYRLQAPYLEDVKGKDWNKGQKELANIINNHNGIIYRFEKIRGLDSVIVVTDDFMDYIHDNYEIVSGWIKYKMIEYLQKRNPSVPGIIYKIDPPAARKLDHAIKYWKQIINIADIKDIYTGASLSETPISIDHFIPWSYVAHDEFWNLLPTTKTINSSKSNNLPNWSKYSDKMCKLQYKAMKISRRDDKIEKLFKECLNEYVNDASIRSKLYRFDQTELEFINNMKEIMEPIYNAAKNLGFREWEITND